MSDGHAQVAPAHLAGVGTVLLAVVIGGAFAGYLHGVSRPPAPEPLVPTPDTTSVMAGTLLPARTYAEMRAQRRGVNAAWPGYAADRLVAPREAPHQTPRDAAAVDALVEARAVRRAFAGAPPAIPHPVDEVSTAACLACHEHGLELGVVRAGRMPHPLFTQCTQCHLAASARPPSALEVANHFEGAGEAAAGARAWPGAPPEIPHGTRMRQDCLACHGAVGAAPLRTPHPDRSNCLQCHLASAALDQQPRLEKNP